MRTPLVIGWAPDAHPSWGLIQTKAPDAESNLRRSSGPNKWERTANPTSDNSTGVQESPDLKSERYPIAQWAGQRSDRAVAADSAGFEAVSRGAEWTEIQLRWPARSTAGSWPDCSSPIVILGHQRVRRGGAGERIRGADDRTGRFLAGWSE